jgi:hypothetical protein
MKQRYELLGICHRAIYVYQECLASCSGVDFNPERATQTANADATYLLEDGDEGIRYGAPGWGHVKLRFGDLDGIGTKTFYLDSNGMAPAAFTKFQNYVSKIFTANALPFTAQ